MDNMEIFNAGRSVPPEALKKITGGKLNGMSDINPMWRIQTLTSLFGPVGLGWYYETVNKWLEPGANGEVVAFVDINLFVKVDGEWSAPIQGSGGSKFISAFKNGPETSDEAYKMATTDALSVCCKLLGIGADVYWANGAKYGKHDAQPKAKAEPKPEAKATVPVDDELPEPKAAKPKAEAEPLEAERAVKAPDGRTLGEILDSNPEELKTVAQANKGDKALTSACVKLYNAWATKKAS